jgi:acyl-CoA synthetase (AMP-forming)/AMP-acid ligase II
VTFSDLARKIKLYAAALQSKGLQSGERIIILLPVSADLYALVLAAMAIGVVAVLINPGLDRKAFFHSIQQVKAKAIVADHFLLKLYFLFPALRNIPLRFSLNSSSLGIQNLQKLTAGVEETEFEIQQVPPDHRALITFTSGTSGMPKGVNRTHGNLIHQHLALKEEFPPISGQTDFPAFPVLTLHNLCCGHTTVMPLIRFKDVSQVKVPLLLEQISSCRVNTLSGAPAYLQKIAEYCLAHHITLPAIKGLAAGGAPVETGLCQQLLQVFPNAEAYIVYGSSEAEPVASIKFTEFLQTDDKRQLGYCVGHLAKEVRVTLVPLLSLTMQNREYPEYSLYNPGEYGEIAVSGEHVCKQYFENPEADKLYKITGSKGQIWHRTGDVGFMDEEKRLWLVGRLEHGFTIQNKSYYPFPFERVVNNLQGVRRSAVLAHHNRLIICLQGEKAHTFIEENIRQAIFNTFALTNLTILYFTRLPVDRRHQSKINYPLLQQWVRNKFKDDQHT